MSRLTKNEKKMLSKNYVKGKKFKFEHSYTDRNLCVREVYCNNNFKCSVVFLF